MLGPVKAGIVRRLARLAAVAALAAASVSAHCGDNALRLSLPLRCDPGRDCWIVNYVDVAAGNGARDYACGRMTYKGHSGTDFAIRDGKAMAEGVPVLAAAGGAVRSVRDGEPDLSVRDRGHDAIKHRECGNAVRIEHAGGWETLYCHLRRGSVSVKPGDTVSAGTPIGLVGLSGKTEFPHVHLAVRHQHRPVDPFLGLAKPAGCGAGAAPLWSGESMASLRYTRGALSNFGVAAEIPAAAQARHGSYRARNVPAAAPVIALWAEVFGAMPGDAIQLELAAPDGSTVISRKTATEREQVRIFRWAARARQAGAWPAGNYRAKITYLNPDVPPRRLSAVDFVIEVH